MNEQILMRLEEKGVKISNYVPSYTDELDIVLCQNVFVDPLLKAYGEGKVNEICISRFTHGAQNKKISTDQVFVAAVEKWVMIWKPSLKQMLIYRVI